MVTDITVKAKLCQCEANKNDGTPCLYKWVSISQRLPAACPSRECRSREWNGKKKRRKPETPIALPKPTRIKGGECEEF